MSTDVLRRCGVCRCYLDTEDLFCANCGTENPHADEAALRLTKQKAHYSFDCQGCGASMSYDASAQALRCPFCGGTDMLQQESTTALRADEIIPFEVERPQAEQILRSWLGKGFWRPSDAAQASRIGKITRVYVPYWVFSCEVDTNWTADSSPTPPGRRGDWYPLSGTRQAHYRSALVGGSSILTPRETASIAPYQVDSAVSINEVDLQNEISETFKVPRKSARPMARGVIEELERSACAKLVPGRSRNVKVNVRISGLIGRPMLLPIWILAYQYRKEVHRVLINGQTGRIAGTAPFSYLKLILIIIAVVIIIAIVFGLVVASR